MNIQDNFNKVLMAGSTIGTAAYGIKTYNKNQQVANQQQAEANQQQAEAIKQQAEMNKAYLLNLQADNYEKELANEGESAYAAENDAINDVNKAPEDITKLDIAEARYHTAYESYNEMIEQKRKTAQTAKDRKQILETKSPILDVNGNNIIKKTEVKSNGKK